MCSILGFYVYSDIQKGTMPDHTFGQDHSFRHFKFSRSNLCQNFVYYVYYYYIVLLNMNLCFSSEIDVVLRKHENG